MDTTEPVPAQPHWTFLLTALDDDRATFGGCGSDGIIYLPFDRWDLSGRPTTVEIQFGPATVPEPTGITVEP